MATRALVPEDLDRNGRSDRAAMSSLTRAALATAQSVFTNRSPDVLVQRAWPEDRLASLLTKAATSPATIANTSALAITAQAFLESMTPASAGAELLGRGLQLRFDGAAVISLPSLTPTEATFIAENAPIPNKQYVSEAAALLKPCKMAALITLTNEMMNGSNAEVMCRQAMIESAAPGLDRVLFDSNPAVDGLRPAGLRNGVSALTPAAAGAKDQAMVDDIVALASAVAARAGNGQLAFIAAPKQAIALAMRSNHAIPYSSSASSVLADGTVICVALPCLASVLDPPRADASQEAVVHLADPASAIATSGVIVSPVASMYQTDSVSLRMKLPVTWALRASGGVSFMTAVTW
jgi:hypothetical protein